MSGFKNSVAIPLFRDRIIMSGFQKCMFSDI